MSVSEFSGRNQAVHLFKYLSVSFILSAETVLASQQASLNLYASRAISATSVLAGWWFSISSGWPDKSQ
jgi:hypothetical protein